MKRDPIHLELLLTELEDTKTHVKQMQEELYKIREAPEQVYALFKVIAENQIRSNAGTKRYVYIN